MPYQSLHSKGKNPNERYQKDQHLWGNGGNVFGSGARRHGGCEAGSAFPRFHQGVEIDIPQGGPPPTSLSVNGSATGIATHLGRFTATYQVNVDLSNGSGIGSLQLIAANGDKIFTTLVGQGTPTGTPGINRIVEVNTITGGSGRFANAKGSFTVERLLDLTTGFTSDSFNGTISSPGSAH